MNLIKEFSTALCSEKRSGRIPEELDFFGSLVGEWEIEWTDRLYDATPRRVKGEWIFSWVLDGTAIQDLFIVPSRSERLINKQPDAEYGTTLRIFNPKTSAWDIFYGCTGEAIRLTARKTGDDIVLTENTTGRMRYVFSDMTATAFHWRKEQQNENGTWQTVARVVATKRQQQNMAQKNAYQKLINRYDDVLTGRKWWSWLYMHCLWKTDDNIVAKEIMEMIPDNFRGRILDVPVGTAVFTHDKYRRMANAEIIGLDYSQAMLDIAWSRFEDTEIKNVVLQQGDVCELPFHSNYFDLVLSMNGFHAFPDKEKAFAEVFRVLKYGGTFCGCFYIKGQRKPADWFVRKVLDKKGLFRPPHYTLEQAEKKLRALFGENLKIWNEGSILIFRCVKPDGQR